MLQEVNNLDLVKATKEEVGLTAEQKKKIPFETIRKAAEEKAEAERESGKTDLNFHWKRHAKCLRTRL